MENQIPDAVPVKQLLGQVGPEQIQAWKKELASKGMSEKIYSYTVDGRIAYLRAVDRNLYSKAAAKVSSAGPAKFNEIVVEGIWLGGDEAIRKDDQYFFGLIDFVEELMGKKKGELGEL